MESIDASKVTQKVEFESSQRLNDAREALDWFLDRPGKLFIREDVAAEVAQHISTSERRAAQAIRQLTGDIVDPVQQVTTSDAKRVGVIEYKTWEDAGAYGYVQFHDLYGQRKRVVCAKCAHDKTIDSEVTHATEGEGTSDFGSDWDELLNKVTAHYASDHYEGPDDIEPGASLVSGTTIAGNITWHSGNDGTGSGLAADTVDGFNVEKNGTDASGVINFKT